ncbi:MAG TPA: DUF3037 domain-containing protein [Candidatus Limnocylindrales bacterium]|nr:DUF3037 domain-containing protein [Candidatus Limnocylindrales bacterium]
MTTEPQQAFEYAVLRVVPRVERNEAVNVGVVVFCRTGAFLGARIELGERQMAVLEALAPDLDLETVRAHLDATRRIVAGEPDAGPIAEMAPPERFRWVTAPASTMIQPSEVHGGVTDAPERSLDDLFERLVR